MSPHISSNKLLYYYHINIKTLIDDVTNDKLKFKFYWPSKNEPI